MRTNPDGKIMNMDVLVRGTAGVGGDAGDAIEFKDITSNYDNAITKKAGRLHLREASHFFMQTWMCFN